MVFQFRGRPRTRPVPFRGRGKSFKGRGQGLLITLNSREGQDSRADRQIPERPRYDNLNRRDDTNYGDSHIYGSSFEEKKRKENDVYEERRGDSSSSIRNRSHDQMDVSADSESLRITVGNERFHVDREEVSTRTAPLSERLGPPVDDSQRGSGSGSRYHREKDIYADDGAHNRDRQSSWYSRQEKGRIDEYMEKRDREHRRNDTAERRSPDYHDWKHSAYIRDVSASDHRKREDVRYDHWEDRHREDSHRSSRERYNREDARYKGRKRDRYENSDRDGKFRKDFSHEFSRKDEHSRNFAKSRQITEDICAGEKYRENNENGDEKKRDSTERSCENLTMSDRKCVASRYSPEHFKKSPKPENQMFRLGILDQGQNLPYPVERSMVSPGLTEVRDSPILSQPAAKPLKSILKKKSEPIVDNHDSGNQKDFHSQVTDFLKSLQSPLSKAADVSDNYLLKNTSSYKAIQEMKDRESHEQGPNLDLTSMRHNEMDVDDEEEFLYGNTLSGHKPHASQPFQQDTLFPIVEDTPSKSKKRSVQSSVSDETNKDLDIHSVTSASLPSWMKPLSKQEGNGEKKEDDMDKTVQNILKSIGFNFDLSKRMQELAKLKKQKEEEAQFPINKNASFLGAGISSADLKAKLFSKEGRSRDEESFIQEVKERVKQCSNDPTGKETLGKQFTDELVSHGQLAKQKLFLQDASVSEDTKGICITSLSSNYATEQISPTVQVGQEKNPVSLFHHLPVQYTSYGGVYQPLHSHTLHTMPPPGQHAHMPMSYNYSLPYPHPSFTHSDPQALPHDAAQHLAMSHSSRLSSKVKRSSNLTVVPLSGDENKAGKKVDAEKKKHPLKRERDKSPEYSRIVIAPKSKDRHDESPVKKALRQHKEGDDKINKASSKEKKEKVLKEGQTEKKSPKPEPKFLPVSAKDQHFLLKESEERKKKLLLLEKELGKLKKHQNEIMRRRQRQRDGHKDPLLVQNSKLQEEITAQIKMLRKASEKSDTFLSTTDGKLSTSVIEDPVNEEIKRVCKDKKEMAESTRSSRKRHEFYDPGNHWCGICNHVSASLLDHLTHLQSRKHKQKCDPYDRPWLNETLETKEEMGKTDSVEISAMKGVEMLMSTDAFYCTLCQIFSGDVSCAEAHIRSEEHFVKYENHIQQNEFYEKRYTLEKTAALSHVRESADQKKGSGLDVVGKREMRASDKVSARVREKQEETSDEVNKEDIHKTKYPTRKKTELIETSEVKVQKEDMLNKGSADSQENRSSKGADKSSDGPSEENIKDDQNFNNTKKQKGEGEDESTKGKIAIKLTGKTGIKPQSKVLPPWTPVTKKIETVKIRPKTESVSLKKGISKSENHPPTSLDMFLTIGGPTTKKLPVYKLRPGTVKKQLCKRASSPDIGKKPSVDKESEELANMKLLGIEDMSPQITSKKAPPPRSQNLSLPKELSSQSSSSAEELYTVFFQNVALSSEEKSAHDVNLDDIPIPPPPPQPPVPDTGLSSEIPATSTNMKCASLDSKQSVDMAVIDDASIKVETADMFEKENHPTAHSTVEKTWKERIPDTVCTNYTVEEKLEEQESKKDGAISIVVENLVVLDAGNKEVKGTMTQVNIASFSGDVEMEHSEQKVKEQEVATALATDKGDTDFTNKTASHYTEAEVANETISESVDVCENSIEMLNTDVEGVISSDKSDSNVGVLNLTDQVADKAGKQTKVKDIKVSKLESGDSSTNIWAEELKTNLEEACGNQAEDALVTDVDDSASACSGSSLLMDSDFEVVDEYEAD